RRRTIRASGSSAPAAPAGGTRPAPGTPRHPPPAPVREDRLSPSCAPCFREPRRTSARYIHRPRRELGGSRAPSFPAPRCIHYQGWSKTGDLYALREPRSEHGPKPSNQNHVEPPVSSPTRRTIMSDYIALGL